MDLLILCGTYLVYGDITNYHCLIKKKLHKTGLYEREELPGLLDRYCIDIVCILPILSETYCYTLSEAVARGIPVIATDIGALGDRVKSMNCGWLVSPQNTYTETLDIIKRIKIKVRNIRKCKKHLSQIHVRIYLRWEVTILNYMETIRRGKYLQKICLDKRNCYGRLTAILLLKENIYVGKQMVR